VQIGRWIDTMLLDTMLLDTPLTSSLHVRFPILLAVTDLVAEARATDALSACRYSQKSDPT
jgi:hypothetical protein